MICDETSVAVVRDGVEILSNVALVINSRCDLCHHNGWDTHAADVIDGLVLEVVVERKRRTQFDFLVIALTTFIEYDAIILAGYCVRHLVRIDEL